MTQMQRQSKALYKIAKFLGLTPCPGCDARGGLWRAHEPKSVGWVLWCYTCGYRAEVD